MPTTACQPFGERSSARTTKFPAALLTSTSTRPSSATVRLDERLDLLRVAHVGRLRQRRGRPASRSGRRSPRAAPGAGRRPRPAAPSRASSSANARPRPLPPPVTIGDAAVERSLSEHRASPFSPRTTRASRPSAPSAVTSNGLISISAISGCSAATRESAAAARAAARTSTRRAARARRRGAAPREASGGAPRPPPRVPGASATATSAHDLGVQPPRAHEQDGPEAAVPLRADDQLEAPGQRRHALDGVARAARSRPPSRSAPPRARLGPARPTATPPESDLCRRPTRLEDDRDSRARPRRRALPRAPPPGAPPRTGSRPARGGPGRRSSPARPRRAEPGSGSSGTSRSARRRDPGEAPGGPHRRLDLAENGDAVRAQRRGLVASASTSCARETAARSPRRPCAISTALAISRLLELLRVLRVAAEVAGQERRVHLARLEQRARNLREAGDVLLPASGEVDRVPHGRGRRAAPPRAGPESVSESSGSSRPSATTRSEATTAWPPPSAASPTRRPRGRRTARSACAMSTTSFGERTSSIPAATAAASIAARSLASAPVWERAARALASVAPPARRTTGLPAGDRAAAARAKARPSWKSSQ